MSTYIAKAIHPMTGVIEDALFIDDYYGKHRYGVKFADNRVYRAEEVRLPIENLEVVRPKADKAPDPKLVEAVARVLQDGSDYVISDDNARRLAHAVLPKIVPLIEAATLERAAQELQAAAADYGVGREIAAAIRALSQAPESAA